MVMFFFYSLFINVQRRGIVTYSNVYFPEFYMDAVREIIFNKKILSRKYLCGVLDVV